MTDSRKRSAKIKADNEERLKELKLYTLTELESTLGVSHRSLLAYIKDGRLKAIKIFGKWRVTEDNLQKFINGEG